MKKSKKIIVFICLFFLCFNIVTEYKREEVKAIALVDDALLWAFGMLVLGTGVVAIKDIQVPHMGSLVLDNLRSSGVSEEEFLIKSADGVLKGVKIYDKVLNAVNNVASSLPNNPFSLELDDPMPWTSGHLLSSQNGILLKAKDSLLNLSAKVIVTDRPIFTVAYSNSTSVYTSLQLCFNGFYDTSFNVGLVRNGDTYSIVSTCQHGSKTIVSNIDGNTPLIFGFYKDYLTAGSTNPMLDIPYDNSKIKEGYNPTHTDQNLPYTAEKPGFIPLPTDTVMDNPISTEIPLTWDDVKSGVTDLPVDDSVPGEDTGEGEGTGEGTGVWDWLKSLLNSILNAIKSILSAITGFLQALLDGILSLLSSLFSPTVSVSDLFSPPVGSGFSLITELFNFDSLWSIEPKPYRFKENWNYTDITGDDNDFSEPVEIRPFEVSIIQDNLSIIRNILSYSILIAVIWFIIIHFLPERSMD